MTESWSDVAFVVLSPVAAALKSLPFGPWRDLPVPSLILVAAVVSSLVFFPIYFGVTKTIPRFERLTRVSDENRARFNRYLGKWGYPGLAVLVGIPGPGTGAVVISSIASALRLSLWKSFLAVLAGCAIQGGILIGVYQGLFRF